MIFGLTNAFAGAIVLAISLFTISFSFEMFMNSKENKEESEE